MALAPAYFPTQLPGQYRRRWGVSLPCSGWERVGPPRAGHQDHVWSVWARVMWGGSDRGGRGPARGGAASRSAIGAARLRRLPGFDVRSIDHVVCMGPYRLEVGGGPSRSVLRA